ncbi:hypothetical protein Sste5346_002088 [Sporothrix stenoceras]|uniref:Uncharacterized protein n=1 Tax=Sporothrix stenoceras TaxID=5173 RepID=A0ABR3ZJW8_9PEZI
MAFHFVNYEGPSLPVDPTVRTLIRRQAMHDVAVDRRARGNYGQTNLRQVPIFVDGWEASAPADDSTQSKGKKKNKANAKAKRAPRPPQPGDLTLALPTSFYTSSSSSSLPTSINFPDGATTEKFTLLLNLVPLTGLRLGIGKLSSFQLDLARNRTSRRHSPSTFTPLDLGNPKLAHYITSHYGDDKAPALRYATDAVIAQLRQVALRAKGTPASPFSRDATLLLYNKALRAVQAALEDEKQRLTEETLCATELLAVFELLSENVASWKHHASGAAQLIHLRGAQRFRSSESGTALFMAHIGTTVMDAFLGNKACFLAEDGWTSLMQSVIQDDPTLTHLQDLSLAIWSHIVTGPGKFKAVTDTVMADIPPNPSVREAIIGYLQQDRASLVGWMERAKNRPGMRDDDFEIDDVYGIMFPRLAFEQRDASVDRVTRLSLWGTNIMCRILKTRLLVAMAPSRFRELEEECQYLAAKVVSLDAVAADGMSTGIGGVLKTSFISQNTWIVPGVIETKEIWADESDDGEDKMIDKWKFEAWCRAIGRKIPRTPPRSPK